MMKTTVVMVMMVVFVVIYVSICGDSDVVDRKTDEMMNVRNAPILSHYQKNIREI